MGGIAPLFGLGLLPALCWVVSGLVLCHVLRIPERSLL